MIDLNQIKLTFAGLGSAWLAFSSSKISYTLSIFTDWWHYIEPISKGLGLLAILAVIWMNAETAITRRWERRGKKRK